MRRALLILLVCSSYLLFAGGPRWTAIPLLILSGVTLLAAWRQRPLFPQSGRAVDWCLGAALLAMVLQLVPLPGAVVALLSPHLEPLRATIGVTSPLESRPNWLPLSVAPTATLDALGTVLIAAMTFWAARALFVNGHGVRSLCRILAVIGGLAALAAILQRQIDPNRVLGTLVPPTPSASPFGAFVNRNHFAAWLLMVAAPAVGYMIAHVRVHSEYRRSWRRLVREALQTGSLFVSLAIVVTLGTLFMTLSRSALLGLGAAAVSGVLMMRRRVATARQAWPFAIALAGTALLILLLFVNVDHWVGRFTTTFDVTQAGANRLTIWRETLPIVQDFSITGTGAGTFSDAMRMYQQSRIWVGSMREWLHFNNAHSHYLHVAAEGGLLLFLPAVASLIALAMAARRAIVGDRSEVAWIRAGAAAGLIGVAVQSIWEIPLAMPANAVLAAVLAALVVHARIPHMTGNESPSAGTR